jgi:glycosidase
MPERLFGAIHHEPGHGPLSAAGLLMHRLVSLFFIAVTGLVGINAEGSEARVMDNPYQPTPYVRLTHPEWSRNAAIYELNTRQFTPEGTFRAAEAHLPRLKQLGVDIIWLMPIHPIGEKNRKGGLGSPYSIRDFYAVNPEFGNLDDLKHFVATAHQLGLYVILDWVANHTAWDNPMASEHPEWYDRDWKGDFQPTPWQDWSDIIDLDYSNPGLRQYMTEAMKYWVTEADIDGYRCDVAGYVPVDFWNNLRRELDQIKPVFMLAEWESRDLLAEAFDMTYAWSWHSMMHDIAQGKADTGSLAGYYSNNESAFPRDAYRLVFVSNHDKNSWEGTQFDLFGDSLEATIALSVIGEGMPLVYSGQEAGNHKRLEFFEKDTIEWKTHPVGGLYRKLLALKKRNTALWNGSWGATMIPVPNNAPSKVFSFVRQNENDKVFAIFNFSALSQTASFSETLFIGTYTDWISGEKRVLSADSSLILEPWSFYVLVK